MLNNLTDGQYFFFGVVAIIGLFTIGYFLIEAAIGKSDLEHTDK